MNTAKDTIARSIGAAALLTAVYACGVLSVPHWDSANNASAAYGIAAFMAFCGMILAVIASENRLAGTAAMICISLALLFYIGGQGMSPHPPGPTPPGPTPTPPTPTPTNLTEFSKHIRDSFNGSAVEAHRIGQMYVDCASTINNDGKIDANFDHTLDPAVVTSKQAMGEKWAGFFMGVLGDPTGIDTKYPGLESTIETEMRTRKLWDDPAHGSVADPWSDQFKLNTIQLLNEVGQGLEAVQ